MVAKHVMLTKQDADKVMKGLGIKKAFKFRIEPETEAIILENRRRWPNEIALMKGYRKEGLWCVLTQQKKKANAYAIAHRLKVRLMDGEAELWVPSSLADKLLSLFGAKVKRKDRVISEATKAALKAHSFKPSSVKTEATAANMSSEGKHAEPVA